MKLNFLQGINNIKFYKRPEGKQGLIPRIKIIY